MTDATPFQEPLPDLPHGWTARIPGEDDLPALVALRAADGAPYTGHHGADEETVRSEIAGQASWSRRQLIASVDGAVRGWVSVQDRAAGRTTVSLYLERGPADRAAVAAALYGWAARQGAAIARLRGLARTRMDASPYAEDAEQRGWLAAAGYERHRRWLHMTRPVSPGERVPELREGVTVRRVRRYESGVPLAADLQVVHRMLEESFQDHFNSYRESFPEFVQRLREDPGHRWDHWWLAFVDQGGLTVPAGAIVCSVLASDSTGATGTYVDYIGVNRAARGRGVAKGLLRTVVADAAERGRTRVGLEVDADSLTQADALYRSMGWSTDYVTESWFADVAAG